MKNLKINKNKVFEVLKNRIAPIMVTTTMALSTSGCVGYYLGTYTEKEVIVEDADQGTYDLLQRIYTDKRILERYSFISNNVIKLGNKLVVRVAIGNDYGFIDAYTLEEIIPVGRYRYVFKEPIEVGNFQFIQAETNSNLCFETKNETAYLDLDTLEEVLPLGEWDKVDAIGVNLLKAYKKDGTFQIFEIPSKKISDEDKAIIQSKVKVLDKKNQ